ncbi:MAG: UbiA-like polyprenyltransferase [Spirochaetota bacterium]|nr:UbiA-like polyprenyltransferase [Spirochaetota bacterium]
MDFSRFSKLILIDQTLYALPFAYIGVLFAGGGSLVIWILVTVALVAARTAGMSFNRVIDARIDAINPRTKDRHIPKGEVKPIQVWMLGITASIVFVGASYMFNPLCFYLSFVAVTMLYTYSYFKRFTSSSHFYLGFIEAAAPIGGYLAVKGEFDLIPLILGFIILCWIAGLDILYAIQDMEFDITERLYSIPAILGVRRALFISAFSYILSFIALIFIGWFTHRNFSFWIAAVGIGGILIYQQRLARHDEISSAIERILAVNRYISPLLFVGVLIESLF